MTPDSRAALAEVLPNVPTIKALTMRLGRFNGAWWERFADELAAMPGWRLVAADAVPDAERLTRLLVEARVDVQRCRNCGHDHGWHDLRLGFGWCAWGAPEEPCDCAGWGGNGPLLERIDAALAAPSEP